MTSSNSTDRDAGAGREQTCCAEQTEMPAVARANTEAHGISLEIPVICSPKLRAALDCALLRASHMRRGGSGSLFHSFSTKSNFVEADHRLTGCRRPPHRRRRRTLSGSIARGVGGFMAAAPKVEGRRTSRRAAGRDPESDPRYQRGAVSHSSAISA